MPKFKQQPTKYDYTVRTIAAVKGGKFITTGEFNCASGADARQAADRLQREFDADCDPCRTYVFNNAGPLPVYAGLGRRD